MLCSFYWKIVKILENLLVIYLKNRFLEFHKVVRWHISGEVDKFTTLWCNVSSRLPTRPSLKPGFHYPSWRPELTARVDGWPVSITRQHGPCWRARVSTILVNRPCKFRKPVTRQLWPLTRAVNSGSANRALFTTVCQQSVKFDTPIVTYIYLYLYVRDNKTLFTALTPARSVISSVNAMTASEWINEIWM